MKIAFCFPGQALSPVQPVLKRLAEFEPARPVIDEGREFIATARPNVSERTVAQLETFIASVASYQIVKDTGVPLSIFAEHSMGIYAALVAAGVIQFAEGLQIVKTAGELIDDVSTRGDYDMAAIVGLGRDKINHICEAAAEEGLVFLANINGPMQFVLSGERTALIAACKLARAQNAAAAKLLGIGAPLHTDLFEHAGRALKKQLATTEFSPPHTPIVQHTDGQFVIASDVLGILSQQLFMPVKWTSVMSTLIREGIDTYIEAAPGDTLSKLIHLKLRNAPVFCLGHQQELQKTIAAICQLKGEKGRYH